MRVSGQGMVVPSWRGGETPDRLGGLYFPDDAADLSKGKPGSRTYTLSLETVMTRTYRNTHAAERDARQLRFEGRKTVQ